MRRLLVAAVFVTATLVAAITLGQSALRAPILAPKLKSAKMKMPAQLSLPQQAMESARVARIPAWQRPTVGQVLHTLSSTSEESEEEVESSGADSYLSSEQPVGSYATLSPNTAGESGHPISGYFISKVGDEVSRAEQQAAGIAVLPNSVVSNYSGYFKVHHSGDASSAYYLITYHLLRLPSETDSDRPSEIQLTSYRHSWGPLWTEVEEESATLSLRPGQETILPILTRIRRHDPYTRAWSVEGYEVAIRAITVDKVG